MRQPANPRTINQRSSDLFVGIALVPIFQLIFWLAGVVIFQIIGNENFDYLFVFDQVATFLAIVQFAYLVPIALYFWRKGEWDIVKGVSIGSLLNMLLVQFQLVIIIAIIFSLAIGAYLVTVTAWSERRGHSIHGFTGGFFLTLFLHCLFILFMIVVALPIVTIIEPPPPPNSQAMNEELGVAISVWMYMICVIGASQLLYQLPVIWYLDRHKRSKVIKGVVIAALLTILLNGVWLTILSGPQMLILIPLLITATFFLAALKILS
jgi:hypothetical protein